MLQTNGNGHEKGYKRPPKLRGLSYYLRCRVEKRPYLVNLEFTKLCNAKCFFCSCWQVESPNELQDYSPVIKRFRPIVCSVSGGEPLLRKNYDEVRKIEGLFDNISKMAPLLASKGYNICLNTIIMESNMDQIIPIAKAAKEWGVHVSFSSFCTLKANEGSEMVRKEKFKDLANLIEEIKALKKQNQNIKNSHYYLDNIAPYFQKGGVSGCKAGHTFIQITPDGYVQRCSELPRMAHYSEYWPTQVDNTLCTKCWYSCRGETEAPFFKPQRLVDLFRA